MTPPAPVSDPLHQDESVAPPPPAVVPPTADTTTTAVVPPVVVQPADPNPPSEPAAETPPNEIWRRLHLVLGGHYTFGGVRLYGEAEPFSSAAAGHHGGGLFIQPSVTAVNTRHFDLNLGLNIRQTWLSVPRSPGSVSSDISATTLGALVEGNVFFHEHFGLGLQGTIGYMGLSSSNADVGAPFSANLGFDGNVALGAQLYAHAWRGAFRLGAGIDWMGGGFGLGAGPGNPELLVSMDPQRSIFLGVDPLQIVRNVQGRAGERPR